MSPLNWIGRQGGGGGGGGGSGGSGKSNVPILAQGSVPDRDDWEDGAYIATDRGLVPVVRELAGGHNAAWRFAPIGSDGREVLATSSLAQNTGRGSPPDLRATYFRPVVVGDVLQDGDFVQYTNSGTTSYYVVNRGFTVVTGNHTNGLPHVSNATGYDDFDRTEIQNRANYLGVYARSADVPSADVVSNRWFISSYGGYVSAERYTTLWAPYTFTSQVLRPSSYSTEESAIATVSAFVSNTPPIFVIDGQVRILASYTAPSAAHEKFIGRAEFADPPSEIYWLDGQTERWPETLINPPASWSGTNSNQMRLRWRRTSGGDEHFGNGHVGLSFPSSAPTGLDAIGTFAQGHVFTLRPGVYDINIDIGALRLAESASFGFHLTAITSSTSDDDDTQASGTQINYGTSGTGALDSQWQAVILRARKIVVADEMDFSVVVTGQDVDDDEVRLRAFLEVVLRERL